MARYWHVGLTIRSSRYDSYWNLWGTDCSPIKYQKNLRSNVVVVFSTCENIVCGLENFVRKHNCFKDGVFTNNFLGMTPFLNGISNSNESVKESKDSLDG